jgi:transcriptional regulator with XRE-family HTH domain
VTGLAEDVREQIRLALRIAGVCQAELARRLGLSEKHISQLLTGRSAISLDMAERILDAVGYTLVVSVREGPASRYRRTSPVPAQE